MATVSYRRERHGRRSFVGVAMVVLLGVACAWMSNALRRNAAAAAPAKARVRSEDVAPDEILKARLLLRERLPLIGVLSHLWTSDPDPHARAIEEARKAKLTRAVPALVDLLREEDSPYRLQVAAALGELPSEDAIAPLMNRLWDRDPRMRATAATSIGLLLRAGAGREAIGDDVSRRLQELVRTDAASEVKVAAFAALLNDGRGVDFMPAFHAAQDTGDDVLRCEVLRTQTFYARLAGTEQALAEGRQKIRYALLQARSSPRPKPAILDVLRERLRLQPVLSAGSRCPDVLAEIALGLAALADPDATPVLTDLAVHGDTVEQRAAAVEALGRLGRPDGVDTVMFVSTIERWGVRGAAISALSGFEDPRAADRLAELLRSGTPLERRQAALALADVPAHSDTLVGAFDDPIVEVRVAAETAVRKRSERVTRLSLRSHEPANADGSTEISSDASGASSSAPLTRFPRQRWEAELRAADRALAAALASPSERVRVRAARVLASSRGPESFGLLRSALQSGQGRTAAAAAFALGLRGDDAARETLEDAARSADPDVALAAARALRDLDYAQLARREELAADNLAAAVERVE